MQPVAAQTIIALNDAESSENRIHSDDIALRYGFSGALVSGVNVFGYMSQPLVKTYGAEWLERGIFDVRFLRPAYHNDLLTISTETHNPAAGARHHSTTAKNARGELLARLESWNPEQLPPTGITCALPAGPALRERSEITWDLIELQRPGPEYLWQPGIDDNLERVNAQRDPSELYRGPNGYIHPYYLLDACNKALMRLFVLPAWIHTKSRLVVREGLRVGQSILVRATPVQKWERKGHQFLTLEVTMLVDGRIAVETAHTAIFQLAA